MNEEPQYECMQCGDPVYGPDSVCSLECRIAYDDEREEEPEMVTGPGLGSA